MNELVQILTVAALPIIFAIAFSTAAMGYTARYFGDTSGQAAGRLTLNPMKHIDLFGTIILPAILFLGTQGALMFGYPKRMPLDYAQLRHPKKQMGWVNAAGPAALFVMAFLWLIAGVLMKAAGVEEPFFLLMSRAGVMVNLGLMAFCLFPLPPLPGGQIVLSMLPMPLALKFERVAPYGIYLMLPLIYFGLLAYWMNPIMAYSRMALGLLASPLASLF